MKIVFMFQILMCERRDVVDDETGHVTRSEYSVTFEKSKTNAKLQGQRRTTLITEAGKEGDPEQYGLDRFLQQITDEGHGSTGELKESIEVVRAWQGGGSFLDDVSLIRLTRRSE